jgi:hypothetical protein
MYAVWGYNESNQQEMLAHFSKIVDAIAFRDALGGRLWVEVL